MAGKQAEPIVGLPLSSDYQEGGLKYDPSQLAPKPKKAPEKKSSKEKEE